MAEDDPVLAVTSVINITDKKVRGQHNITLLQLSVSQTKKVRGQHNITNTVDSLHMDEISLHKNLRPVGPVVSQNILIPKKITGPNQGPYSLFDRSKMVYIYVWKSLVYNNNI